MRANELRINNIVKYHNDDTFFRVIRIDELGIEVENEEQSTWIEYDCFSGIELTEDWLVKLGFERAAYSFDLGKVSISLPSTDILLWKNGRTYFNGWKIMDAPKCVHQLQNLYFALTNEELTLTRLTPS